MASANVSDYLYNLFVGDYLTNNAIYVALFTTAPNLDGTGGTEVSNSGTGYARVQIPANGFSGASGPDLSRSNLADVTFGAPVTNWGTIVAAGLYDSDIGGTNELLWRSIPPTPNTVVAGSGAPKILAGKLIIKRATC